MSRSLSILANMYLNWRLHSMKHWRGLLNRYINTTANISDIRTWVNVLYICYLSKLAIPLFYTPYVHNKMVCRFDILKSWISTVDKCEVGSESCSVVQYKWNHERLVECWVVWSQSRYHQWIYHIPVYTSTTAVETTSTRQRSVELGVCPMQLFHFWSRDVHSVQNLLLCTKFWMIFQW